MRHGRSKIIKGPDHLEVSFSSLYVQFSSSYAYINSSILPVWEIVWHGSHTSIHWTYSSAKNETWMGHFLPFATISITGYKLATSFLKDIIYFCPCLINEGAFSDCKDHVMADSEKEETATQVGSTAVIKAPRISSLSIFSHSARLIWNIFACLLSHFSCVRLFVTLWTL